VLHESRLPIGNNSQRCLCGRVRSLISGVIGRWCASRVAFGLLITIVKDACAAMYDPCSLSVRSMVCFMSRVWPIGNNSQRCLCGHVRSLISFAIGGVLPESRLSIGSIGKDALAATCNSCRVLSGLVACFMSRVVYWFQ
jgi:hypothetical protein